MMNIGQLWDQLVDCICRPPRDAYGVEDLIGGYGGRYSIGSHRGFREDLELVNSQGQKLQCSHFKPQSMAEEEGPFPCVVYCHCNSGSRRDAEEAVILLIPQKISVFCLDFAGSGLSEGDWVTLGAYEVDDLRIAIDHLRTNTQISTIALWGRSMGAVTALMYSRKDPSIAGMVLDSPFSKLNDLMLELVQEQQVPIPRAFVRLALMAMRRSVRKRAKFDIYDISPVDIVGESFVPVLFGHADGDTFIKKSHSERLLDQYAGDKNLITFSGDHNSRRTQFFYSSVTIFFHNTLKLQGDLAEAQPDLPVINGPHHEIGATNVPWQAIRWEVGRGSNSDEFDGDDVTEEELRALMKMRQQHVRDGEFAWYQMLPGSHMEEETMLQAALKASYEETKPTNEESRQNTPEQSQCSKAEGSVTDPSLDETVDVSSPSAEPVKTASSPKKETPAVDGNVQNNADPPLKEEGSE